MTPTATMTRPAPAATTARLRHVLHVHFDPDLGTPFWIDRARSLGIDPRREIDDLDDLRRLGDMLPAELTNRPLLDYVPRRFHADLSDFVVGQTGGTTGNAAWTAYRSDEFVEAFVTPFAVAARHVGFPFGEQWLYIGPGGPHVIGKAAVLLARAQGGHDPFTVDFDPRWARRLVPGSFAGERYLEHVVEQALAVIRRQAIGVLFTTPVVLERLAEIMSAAERERVRGIHYGGMPLAPETLRAFQRTHYPNAVHLSGYGNTLFGCCLELSTGADRRLEYYPHGARLHFEIVDADGLRVPDGETGRVRVSRLDESGLIVNLLERDHASMLPPPAGAPPGFGSRGLADPASPPALAPEQQGGLY